MHISCHQRPILKRCKECVLTIFMGIIRSNSRMNQFNSRMNSILRMNESTRSSIKLGNITYSNTSFETCGRKNAKRYAMLEVMNGAGNSNLHETPSLRLYLVMFAACLLRNGSVLKSIFNVCLVLTNSVQPASTFHEFYSSKLMGCCCRLLLAVSSGGRSPASHPHGRRF